MQENELVTAWFTLHRQNRIVKGIKVECGRSDVLLSALDSACKKLDLARPVILSKHERELADFSRTSFTASDFMEPFKYKSLYIEVSGQDDENKKGRDWRTQI